MKIIVTGATGFLGTALCARLEHDGHDVVRLSSKNADLRTDQGLCTYSAEKYDVIYHLAAWTQAGDFCLSHPGEQWIINQQINTNVLAWWHQSQPQAKLVSMGTSCAYAPDKELIEENYLLGSPIESLFTYAMTKRMLYGGLQALHQQFGHQYLCIVPSTLYGPGYHTDGRQMHFIFDLIRKIIRGKLFGETVTLWGDGFQQRELIYVDDFVDATVQLTAGVSNDLVNVGSGQEHTIREFAQSICAIVDYPFESIEFDTSRYVGAKSKVLNIARLNGLLPERHSTPPSAGLEATIAWFWKEQDVLFKAARA